MPKKTPTPPAPLLAGWLLPDQAAERSGWTENTIRRYCTDGKIPHQRIGSVPIIHEDVLDEFVANRLPRGRKPGYSPKKASKKKPGKAKRKKGGA